MSAGWTAERWQNTPDALEMLHCDWPRLSSDRKCWLFASACWREVWDLIGPETRRCVERLERFADSPEESWTQEELDEIIESLTPPREFAPEQTLGVPWDLKRARRDVTAILTQHVLSPAERSILFEVFYGELESASRAGGAAVVDAWQQQCAGCAELLRDVIGNPFLPPRTFAPGWLTWNDSTVLRIATAIYDERDFARLAVLGDAPEEAGCDEPEILGHCRTSGRHARGCWLVDSILGRHVLVDRPARS